MNKGEGKSGEEKDSSRDDRSKGKNTSSVNKKSEQKQNEEDSTFNKIKSTRDKRNDESKRNDENGESKDGSNDKRTKPKTKEKLKEKLKGKPKDDETKGESKDDTSTEKDIKKRADDSIKRNRKKKSENDDKSKITDDSSMMSSSTSKMSVFGKAMFGWAPLSQSMEDRDGSTTSCLPRITDDLMESMCFSRDECSWMCCRSERLGGLGFCAQSMLCVPMLCANRCACSCIHNGLLLIGECPCARHLRWGLHKQSPPRDPVILTETRDFIRQHQERGCEDDICLIRVIGCDRPLLERVSVLHPMVRVHAVNILTGQYLKRVKADEIHDVEPKGCITTHESSTVMSTNKALDLNEDSLEPGLTYNTECDRVLPVSTTPFPLKRCMEPPRWQEGGGDLVINEPYDTILDPETLLLVEVCDFTSAGISSKKHDAGSDSGYVGIAWGFLMPVSRSGRPCIGIRGGSKNDEELGATPRDKKSKYIPKSKKGGAYDEADTVNKRLTLQLFKWRHSIDYVALAQAKHRGILPLSAPASSPVPAVYLQWYLRQRKAYPVTLALRIGPISRPRVQKVNYRPNNCFQFEIGNKNKEEHLSDLGDEEEVDLSEMDMEGVVSSKLRAASSKGVSNEAIARRAWSSGGKCALPTKLLVKKSLGNGGATALKYSHCGKWVAVATSGITGNFPILILDLDDEEGVAKQSGVLRGHVSLIHDLDWSDDNHFLVSSSGDGSAIVWNVANITDKKGKRRRSMEKLSTDPDATSSPSSPAIAHGSPSGVSAHKHTDGYAIRVLHPCPSVVYAARFIPRQRPTQPAADSTPVNVPHVTPCPLVVTGSFDGATLLWDPCKEQPNLGLLGGLQAPLHRFSVTALVVEHRSRRVFSGDSDGIIWAWALASQSSSSKQTPPPKQKDTDKNEDQENSMISYNPESRPISHNSLRGRTITSLEVQPTKSTRKGCCNLLVAAHGNLVLLFDSEAKALLAQYHGTTSHTSPIKARFSPDGRYVISGSEDGFVVVWNTNNDSNAGVGGKEDTQITQPVISHTKMVCPLSSMGFNAPLIDIAWNPKQHCVAMVASGGSFPLLVAYSESPPKEATKEEEMLATLMEPQMDHTSFSHTMLKENLGGKKTNSSISDVLRLSVEAGKGGSRGGSLRRPSLQNVLRDSLKRESFSNLASPSGKDPFNMSFSGMGTPTGRMNFSGLATPTGSKRDLFSGMTSPNTAKGGIRSLAKAKLSEIRARQFLNQSDDEDQEHDGIGGGMGNMGNGGDMGTPTRYGGTRDLAPLSEGASSASVVSAEEDREESLSPLLQPVKPKPVMDPSFH